MFFLIKVHVTALRDVLPCGRSDFRCAVNTASSKSLTCPTTRYSYLDSAREHARMQTDFCPEIICWYVRMSWVFSVLPTYFGN